MEYPGTSNFFRLFTKKFEEHKLQIERYRTICMHAFWIHAKAAVIKGQKSEMLRIDQGLQSPQILVIKVARNATI